MRFVFLSLGYAPDLDGGGYRYATEVAELLSARGHEVHVLYPNPDEQFVSRERRRGVELHRLPRGGGGFLKRWRAANRTARQRVIELLREGTGPTLLFSHHAYLEPALHGFPYVAMLHGPWALEHQFSLQATNRGFGRRLLDELAVFIMRRVERRFCAEAAHLVVASDYSRSMLPSWHPGLDLFPEVVGGGADLLRFQPPDDRTSVRAGWAIKEDEFIFLTVRRLDPRMGLKMVIKAFSELGGDFSNARLWLAGRGRQQAELAADIVAAGLGERVRLLGYVPEEKLSGLYAAADCVLMPSLDLEGFGLVTAEALATGTPVAASRAGANAEVVGAFSPSLLFPAGDAVALSQKMREIMASPTMLPSRERCAAHAREQFRWDRPGDACERAWRRWAVPAEGSYS